MMSVLGATIAVAASCIALTAQAQPVQTGKQVFDRWCGACHAPGSRTPGTSALQAKYGGQQPAALEQRKDLTPDVVKLFVRQGVSIMPPFRKTEISDAELNALADYLAHTSGGEKW